MEVDMRDSGRERFAEGGSRGAGAEAGGVEGERREFDAAGEGPGVWNRRVDRVDGLW
jgi:hypothetical protein